MTPGKRAIRPPRRAGEKSLSITEARRIALAAQGFASPRPAGRVTVRHLERTLRRLEVLQLDFVNVLLPAHYFVPFSRLGPYDRSRLDRLVYRERKFIEQWAHEACIVPMQDWGLLRHRREDADRRVRAYASYLRRHAEHAREVLEIVRERGPVAAGELAEPDGGPKRRGPWWGWSISKTVLEGHFVHGRLAVADRRSDFARLYDLAERVVPSDHWDERWEDSEARRELVRRAARAHGVGTARDLADYFRMNVGEARRQLVELVARGEILEVGVEGWREPAYLHSEAIRPRHVEARAILSPFDPLIWYRPRVERLFDFEYRIEIYTPKPKRRWGYYVLPFLLGDRLVARVDLKADREARTLLVLAAHREPSVAESKVTEPLAEELLTLARWLDLERVAVERRGDLARALVSAVRGSRR